VISTLIIILAATFLFFVFCKIGGGLKSFDSMAIFMIFSYLTIFTFRFIFLTLNQFEPKEKGEKKIELIILPVILDICEILVWASISIFVFKMKSVKNKLISESPQIYQ
jgi:hypothetical protein